MGRLTNVLENQGPALVAARTEQYATTYIASLAHAWF
jgi:hypothetical protein